MKKVLFNWSGGKDSSLALYHALQGERYIVTGLLTSFNGANSRVSMHGTRKNLVEEQARNIGLELHPLMLPEQVGMEEYDAFMQQALEKHKKKGVRSYIFGDIFLEDLRAYREQQLQKVDMEAIFPLWQQSTEQLARQFIDVGFKAVVVSINGSKLDRSFVGREYDSQFLADLPAEVDPCGEYGEFHTFVYDGPIFDTPVSFQRGEVVAKTYEQQDDDTHSFQQSGNNNPHPTYFYLDLKSK
ncbi:adenine nucleotide alpha hydrolase [Fodinibius salsisoli]|uniref:Adenine nucleotide alpha hydrolase n=1 Tax=Fodinibius salsisoli TaxID=2820877 RepID=A0ABT3PQC6_9BACT|nr:adenine nucleotide alpha hydrolase [Fodinibius salsisoli]MCW9708064.1 adenine nucleotide alpha hydrolase [Fodinibius salsisoli]